MNLIMFKNKLKHKMSCVNVSVFRALKTSQNPMKLLLVFASPNNLTACFTELQSQMVEWVNLHQLFYMSFKTCSK